MYHIYGYEGCDYCSYAIDLLTTRDLQFTYYDIKSPDNLDKRQFILDQGFSTVPQVFLNKTHIGGFTDLESHVNAL